MYSEWTVLLPALPYSVICFWALQHLFFELDPKFVSGFKHLLQAVGIFSLPFLQCTGNMWKIVAIFEFFKKLSWCVELLCPFTGLPRSTVNSSQFHTIWSPHLPIERETLQWSMHHKCLNKLGKYRREHTLEQPRAALQYVNGRTAQYSDHENQD